MTWDKKYKKFCYSLYAKLKNAIVPGLNNSQYEYRDLLPKYINQETRWLDLGCGHEFFPGWMTNGPELGSSLVESCGQVVGVDCDVPSVKNNHYIDRRLVGDGGFLPFKSDSFHLITANMVVEHIEFPDQVLGEISRVLKPGGIFIFHTPNFLNYMTIIASLLPNRLKLQLIRLLEGREEYDIFPAFYRLNTPRLVKKYAERQKLKVHELVLTKTSAETIMLGPLVIIELVLTKVCEWSVLRKFRSIIICVLKKP